ncbi:hypothetical protein [Rhizobium phaseoli]|uniref:hypothetical protein n=1 Tax=Rhizobium phaseoli TaxID=396 RepID=UPI0011AE9FAC|nr:hypothetical protein [Rhizobium phaseoli]
MFILRILSTVVVLTCPGPVVAGEWRAYSTKTQEYVPAPLKCQTKLTPLIEAILKDQSPNQAGAVPGAQLEPKPAACPSYDISALYDNYAVDNESDNRAIHLRGTNGRDWIDFIDTLNNNFSKMWLASPSNSSEFEDMLIERYYNTKHYTMLASDAGKFYSGLSCWKYDHCTVVFTNPYFRFRAELQSNSVSSVVVIFSGISSSTSPDDIHRNVVAWLGMYYPAEDRQYQDSRAAMALHPGYNAPASWIVAAIVKTVDGPQEVVGRIMVAWTPPDPPIYRDITFQPFRIVAILINPSSTGSFNKTPASFWRPDSDGVKYTYYYAEHGGVGPSQWPTFVESVLDEMK